MAFTPSGKLRRQRLIAGHTRAQCPHKVEIVEFQAFLATRSMLLC